jgi:DNA gyrase subunit A
MDIKTEPRNGPVIGVASVRDDDELLMITARGKIQRIRASDVRVVGRNTQGVRIMTLEEADTLAAVVRVPPEERGAAGEVEPLPESPPDSLPESPPESQSEGEPGPV